MSNWSTQLRNRWKAVRGLVTARPRWSLLRVVAFAVSVPLLLRLRLERLDAFLEQRIAAGRRRRCSPIEVDALVRVVALAQEIGPPFFRRGCLCRGLTLYYFLRQAGFEVTLCFGFRWREERFSAHCWLERDGAPYLEPGSSRRFSEPILQFPRGARACTVR